MFVKYFPRIYISDILQLGLRFSLQQKNSKIFTNFLTAKDNGPHYAAKRPRKVIKAFITDTGI